MFVLASWPLTGRSAQLEELGRQYRDQTLAGVVLHGPAGVAKTRLAEEALLLAERGGRRVERAIGHPATREIPLGALAHLLPADLTAESGVAEDARTALFHAARAEPRRLAADDRLVLPVDDLESSGRCCTVRWTHPSRSPCAPSSRVCRAATCKSSGSSYAARSTAVCSSAGEAWHLSGALPRTGALEELVAEHVAAVDASGRAVLELLAICERFGLDDLARIHGLSTLESLETNGLIFTVASDRRIAVRPHTRCTAKSCARGWRPFDIDGSKPSSPTSSRRTARDVATMSYRSRTGTSPPGATSEVINSSAPCDSRSSHETRADASAHRSGEGPAQGDHVVLTEADRLGGCVI